MSEARLLTPDEIERARERIRTLLPPTPLRRSFALRPHPAWLKLECWQPTGSFKVRGALHHLLALSESEGRRGVVAASAGNHALGVAWALFMLPIEPILTFPFFKKLVIDLGPFYALLVVVVLVGCSNAVNLTDGLDGLAIGATLVVAATYAIFTYIAGNRVAAEYLQVASVPGVGEVAVFCTALVGASLGFLWWNSHPADVFMGDVGSLALGGALATVAILIKQELLLVIVGGIFVIEAASVVIQVASFKLTGQRVFKMAPIHHHFELIGWSEPKVITRFLIVAVIFALFSLTTLKLR